MFPDDFFDAIQSDKSPSTPSHPKIFNNPTTTKQRHIEYVPIIEEKIEYRICKDIQSVNTINRPSLDIDILNEEPSTSGSSNASNNSNRNSHCNPFLPLNNNSCTVNPNDFYSLPTITVNPTLPKPNNEDILKQTGHFNISETEPNQTKKVTIHRNKSANKKVTKASTERERPNTERGISRTKKKCIENKKNNLPSIYPNAVEKELMKLMNNLPKEYYNDPEINKKFNILIQNIDDIKEVIQKKSTPTFNSKTSSHNNCFNNKPITRGKKKIIIQPKKI